MVLKDDQIRYKFVVIFSKKRCVGTCARKIVDLFRHHLSHCCWPRTFVQTGDQYHSLLQTRSFCSTAIDLIRIQIRKFNRKKSRCRQWVENIPECADWNLSLKMKWEIIRLTRPFKGTECRVTPWDKWFRYANESFDLWLYLSSCVLLFLAQLISRSICSMNMLEIRGPISKVHFFLSFFHRFEWASQKSLKRNERNANTALT